MSQEQGVLPQLHTAAAQPLSSIDSCSCCHLPRRWKWCTALAAARCRWQWLDAIYETLTDFRNRKLDPLQKPHANTPTKQQDGFATAKKPALLLCRNWHSGICNGRLPAHENNDHVLIQQCPSEYLNIEWILLNIEVLSGSNMHCQVIQEWVDMVLMSTEPWAKDSVAVERHPLPCHWSRCLLPPALHHPDPKLTTCPDNKAVPMSVA